MSIDAEKVLASPLTIGALGSLVALKFAPGENWIERLTNVVAGSLTAYFGTPAISEWMHFSQASTNLAAFVIGLVSMSLIASILQGMRALDVAGIMASWLRRGG